MQIHAGIAAMTAVPEIALASEEAKALGTAMAEVQSHYGSVIDPKTEAWVKLTIVAASIYAPRVMMVRHRMMNAKRKAAEPIDNVTTLYGDSSTAQP